MKLVTAMTFRHKASDLIDDVEYVVKKLKDESGKPTSREAAIAVTHLETAVLWMSQCDELRSEDSTA